MRSITILLCFGALFLSVRADRLDADILQHCLPINEFWRRESSNFYENKIDDIFVPSNRLGKGGQGVVYRTRYKNLPIIAKISAILADDVSNLPNNEIKIYKQLENFPYTPHMYPCAYTTNSTGRVRDALLFADNAGSDIFEFLAFGGSFSYLNKIKAFITIAKIIREFHRRGFIHYDIRPQNILYDQIAKKFSLIDFGLTCIKGTVPTNMNILSSPPEQPRNTYPSKCVESVDFWQFFITIAIMFFTNGENGVYTGVNLQYLMYHNFNEASINRIHSNLDLHAVGMKSDLKKVVHKGLSFNPADRFQNIDEIIIALEEVQRNEENPRVAAYEPNNKIQQYNFGPQKNANIGRNNDNNFRPDRQAELINIPINRYKHNTGHRIPSLEIVEPENVFNNVQNYPRNQNQNNQSRKPFFNINKENRFNAVKETPIEINKGENWQDIRQGVVPIKKISSSKLKRLGFNANKITSKRKSIGKRVPYLRPGEYEKAFDNYFDRRDVGYRPLLPLLRKNRLNNGFN